MSADFSALDAELETPLSEGGGMFCGVTEQEFAISGVTHQWPRTIRELTWGVTWSRLGTLSDMDCKDAITAFLQEIADCCDRLFRYVPNANGANIKYTAERLDGSSGVLAQMRIPVGNVNQATQLLGQFDDSENYVLAESPAPGTIDFYRVGLHETEHSLGLGHKPPSIQKPALISAVYSPTLRHLQQADKDELVRRYGPAVAVPPPTVPVPGGKPVVVTVEQDGKKWSGQLTRVS